MTPKKPAPARAWRLRAALQALAERGINGEQANAKVKLARLLARFDFEQVDPMKTDLFSGRFDKGAFAVPVVTIEAMDIASAVKWAIEGRTGISCRFAGAQLLAEATPGTAKTLEGIAGTLAQAFASLWQTYERAGGIRGDRNCFLAGLFDGLMQETRAIGQPLPARGIQPRLPKRKTNEPAPGLSVHPYSLALEYGKQIRFSVPVATVERELTDALTGLLKSGTENKGCACGRKLHGFMPPCVLPAGHDGNCEDGFGGNYNHGEQQP